MNEETSARTNPVVSITPRPVGVFRLLVVVILIVLSASLLAHTLRFVFGYSLVQTFGFTALFDPNRDTNILQWVTSLLLLISAALVTLIAMERHSAGGSWYRHWLLLAAILLFLSIDESARIHPWIMMSLRSKVHLPYPFSKPAMLAAAVLLPVFLLTFRKFLLHLPHPTRRTFILSGLVYLSGAVLADILSTYMKHIYGIGNIRYTLMSVFEAFLEMLGLAIFIYALLDRMARDGTTWTLSPSRRQK